MWHQRSHSLLPLAEGSRISTCFAMTVGLAGLAAAELELVVLCRLEQAAISQQKHHAPMGARTILSALKLLQNSYIFQPRKPAIPQPRWVSVCVCGGGWMGVAWGFVDEGDVWVYAGKGAGRVCVYSCVCVCMHMCVCVCM